MSQARFRDGRSWRIGTAAHVAWIERAVDFSALTITEIRRSSPRTAGLSCQICDLRSRTLPWLPRPHTTRRWSTSSVPLRGHLRGWLGYLEYGTGIDVIFDDAPRTSLFGWDFVLVQAGAEQAIRWRSGPTSGTAWKGSLPDLIFPADRAWMLFTSWDDFWSGIGGSEDLIGAFQHDRRLERRVRQLTQ